MKSFGWVSRSPFVLAVATGFAVAGRATAKAETIQRQIVGLPIINMLARVLVRYDVGEILGFGRQVAYLVPGKWGG